MLYTAITPFERPTANESEDKAVIESIGKPA